MYCLLLFRLKYQHIDPHAYTQSKRDWHHLNVNKKFFVCEDRIEYNVTEWERGIDEKHI